MRLEQLRCRVELLGAAKLDQLGMFLLCTLHAIRIGQLKAGMAVRGL